MADVAQGVAHLPSLSYSLNPSADVQSTARARRRSNAIRLCALRALGSGCRYCHGLDVAARFLAWVPTVAAIDAIADGSDVQQEQTGNERK
jgi:hypothetical protein